MGTKFLLAVGAILLSALTIACIGLLGLVRIESGVDRLISEDFAKVEAMAEMNDALDHLAVTALYRISVLSAAESERLDGEVDRTLIPDAIRSISAVRELSADDPAAGRRLDEIQTVVDELQRIRRTQAQNRADTDAAAVRADAALAQRTERLFERMAHASDELRAAEVVQTAEVAADVKENYRNTWQNMAIGTAATLLVGLVLVQMLNRNLVPRIRTYARFADEISAARSVTPLKVRGRDELADLGRALNRMVADAEQARLSGEDQSEFIGALQVTASEEEAHDLLQRHLERALVSATVTVLRRNNSENRLDAAMGPDESDPLMARLSGAEPRSCLAIRFSRTHCEGGARRPLKVCGVCHEDRGNSTCEPLLVGGELIGAVLVRHPEPLGADGSVLIDTTVAQAAPVLANLRNLALSDFRANNDALTGLPNRRATEDTLQRMVAQANRSVTPLTAVMLDLDHFKHINDRYGHGTGDEVLAAVGAAINANLRASDFAGRYGGEEFLILLPNTSAQGGMLVAEKVREAIRSITLPTIDKGVTASLGVADLFQNGGSAGTLVREADRALYTAKAAGRDRTVLASSTHHEPTDDAQADDPRADEPRTDDFGTEIARPMQAST